MLKMIGLLRQTARRYLSRRLQVPEIPVALERLCSQDYQPELIFDVGAYRGDFSRQCLRIWPESQVICFEPQLGLQSQLAAFADSSPSSVRIVPMLLGADPCDAVTFYESGTESSVLAEHYKQSQFKQTSYPMTTVDRFVADELCGTVPDFMKLDVQGYELEVLKGAAESLPEVQVLLLEINLIDIHQDVPLLDEVVGWLRERGFVAYDVCGITRRPLDSALWQVDMVFVQADNPLRANKHWR